MEVLIKELQTALQKKLGEVGHSPSTLKEYDTKLLIIGAAIREIKGFPIRHPFDDRSTEIMYFKHWAPFFFKTQILYTLLYDLERIRITSITDEHLVSYLKKKRKRITRFLIKNEELRLYHQLSQTDRDEELFVQTPPSKKGDLLSSDPFYCENSIRLAKIMAYEEYLPTLDRELNAAGKQAQGPMVKESGQIASLKKYKWKPNKSQTAEIIYSFVKLKCIEVEGQDADITELASMFKELFDIDLGNIYDVHLHNKRRKKDKAPFLHSLLNAFLENL